MNDSISAAQIAYLKSCQSHKIKIQLYRIGILLFFLSVWEVSARMGWIDDFIFSSPSKLLSCFFYMTKENHLFYHIGITLLETIASFFLVMACALLLTILLWYSKTATETLDPYLVVLNSLCTCPAVDRLAGRKLPDDHFNGHIRCNLRHNFKPLYRLSGSRRRKNPPDSNAWRRKNPCFI